MFRTRRRTDDDDDNFEILTDSRGRRVKVVRDGGRVRVPLNMRDSDSLSPVQRAIMADKAARQRNQPLVTDGSGNLLNLHKPGWRYLTDANARMMADAAKAAAYQEVEQRDAQAWKGETGTTNEFIGQREGDLCTDRQHVVDAREQAYLDYDREQAERWRSPR